MINITHVSNNKRGSEDHPYLQPIVKMNKILEIIDQLIRKGINLFVGTPIYLHGHLQAYK